MNKYQEALDKLEYFAVQYENTKADKQWDEIAKEIQSCKKILQELIDKDTSKWIPCSERLPIHEGECLVTCKGKYRHFTEVLYFQHGRFLSCLCEVVAWFDAPLPEPYKGE